MRSMKSILSGLRRRVRSLVSGAPSPEEGVANPVKQHFRIEITNICDLRCTMCPQSTAEAGVKRGLMDRRLYEKIVDEVSAFPENRKSAFYLHICGEPLLHKECVPFIAYAAKTGLRTILVTNATHLTAEKSRELVEAGLSKIELSFEGFSKELYELYRVRASFEKVSANIETFLEVNAAMGNKVQTELVVVDLPDVSAEIKAGFVDSMRAKFDIVNLSGYFDWLGKVDEVHYERRKYIGCQALVTDLNVLYDGTVVPCCMDVYGDMPVGDFRTMSYAEVLRATQRSALFGRLLRADLAGLPCEKCCVPWDGRKTSAPVKSNGQLIPTIKKYTTAS